MLSFDKRLGVIPALFGLGLAALAVTSGQAGTTSAGPVQCGITSTTQNGMLMLEGALRTDVAVNGSYQLRLQSSGSGGSSNISQGGNFSAAAHDNISLGKVMINAGSKYDLVFEVTANGQKLDCDQELVTTL